jgi:hypothetical protein
MMSHLIALTAPLALLGSTLNEVVPNDDPVPGPGLLVPRGPSELPLHIPENEDLTFNVVLRLGILPDTIVGKFQLTTGVEPYFPGLTAPVEAAATHHRVGWIKSHATGRYMAYELDHNIEMRVLPQGWPHILYRDTQSGSENRRREFMYGVKDGELSTEYRSDTHCSGCKRREHYIEGTWFTKEHHCKKCKRAEHRHWRETTSRPIPEGSVDMLSAIFLSRSLIRSGLDEITFPLLDRTKIWELNLSRGKQRSVKVPSGRFLCREVRMKSGIPADEAADRNKDEFKGLFGIHGTIHVWLEERTGVPVMIEGLVPVGPIDLDVSLELAKFAGTPKEFVEVEK